MSFKTKNKQTIQKGKKKKESVQARHSPAKFSLSPPASRHTSAPLSRSPCSTYSYTGRLSVSARPAEPRKKTRDLPRAGRAASPRPRSAAQPRPLPVGPPQRHRSRRPRARCPRFERCHVKIILGKAVPALSRAWRAPRAPGTDAGPPSARTAGAKRQQRSVPGCAPLHRGFLVTHSAGLASADPGPGLGRRHGKAGLLRRPRPREAAL